MTNLQALFIVIAIIIGTVAIITAVLPFLKRQGVDVGAILDRTKDALVTVNKTLDTVRPFIAESVDVNAFDKILEAARVGVGNAEQLYNIGQLDPSQRKAAAREYIVGAVNLAGVKVTPEVEKLIDGAIEAEVLDLKQFAVPLQPVLNATFTDGAGESS